MNNTNLVFWTLIPEDIVKEAIMDDDNHRTIHQQEFRTPFALQPYEYNSMIPGMVQNPEKGNMTPYAILPFGFLKVKILLDSSYIKKLNIDSTHFHTSIMHGITNINPDKYDLFVLNRENEVLYASERKDKKKAKVIDNEIVYS